MKANELMIGDWVISNDLLNRPARYAGIFTEHTPLKGQPYRRLRCMWPGDIEGADVPEERVLPIHLTTGILEKNGWKKVGEDERTGVPVMQFVYDGNAFWWTPTNGECGCEDVENEDGEEKFVKVFSCLQICYVHQLQHALRLCGIDKEITL